MGDRHQPTAGPINDPTPQPAALATDTTNDAERPWLVLVSVALGLLMVVVDVTILNVALPSVTADFATGTSGIEWTVIAYTLALTVLVPFFGRISDVLGRKRLFITGVLIFAGASLLASLAPALGWLIAARLLQAVGGAQITTNALAIITDTFPAGRRGTAMGVQAILVSGGAALGPTLGGLLVTQLGWRSVFYVNIPIGIIAALVARRVLPPLTRHRTLEPIDWRGTFSLVGGMGSLLLAVTRGPEWGWASPPVVGLVVVGLGLLAAFIAWERRISHPLVDLTLFRILDFTAGQLAGLFLALALASMTFLFPFYWQVVRGFSAQEAGLLMLPMSLCFMLLSPIAGRLSDRWGARVVASTGLVLAIGGLGAISRITAGATLGQVLWRLVPLGCGLGAFMAANNNAVMSSVPANKRGLAAGLLGMGRYTGQSLGVALSGTILGQVLSTRLGSAEMPSPDMLAGVAGNPTTLATFRHGFIGAMNTMALIAALLAAVGLAVSLLRGPAAGVADGSHDDSTGGSHPATEHLL